VLDWLYRVLFRSSPAQVAARECCLQLKSTEWRARMEAAKAEYRRNQLTPTAFARQQQLQGAIIKAGIIANMK